MPNAKTTLRVAMAAVAAPGIIAGMAAPAAHAAELPSTDSVKGHVSDVQHTSLDQAQERATSSMHQATSHRSVSTAQSDVTGSNLLETGNSLNGQSVRV